MNVSVRTHLDPVKMASLGFPRPEWKLALGKLTRGTIREMGRMSLDNVFVDKGLAERFAMVNLLENPDFYA